MRFAEAIIHDFSLNEVKQPDKVAPPPEYLDVFTLIKKFEKCMFLGCLIHLNSLLYTITVMPFQFIMACVRFRPIVGKDIVRFCLTIGSAFVLFHFFSLSKWYHDLKEQDSIKLSAAYAMVEVFDRLLGAFGHRNLLLLSNHGQNIIET